MAPVSEATSLKGLLGGATAGRLARHRDLHTVGDLLSFWPRRYLGHTDDLAGLHLGEFVVVVAQVRSATTRSMRHRRGRMLNVVITDGTHDVDLTFFDARGHEHKLRPGARAVFAGEVTRYRGHWQIAHPGYTLLDQHEGRSEEGLIPVYRHVPKVHNWTLSECVRLVLDHVDDLPDVLPETVRHRRDLPARVDAVRWMHRPSGMRDVERARRRLRYEEAFVLQCLLARRRRLRTEESTTSRVPRSGGALDAFDARLPFELTEGQREVGAVIARDLGRDTPMHRLLQGEVGSGKTIVALRAMLAVVDAGGQAALLAPTEVLAQQHHRSITGMLGDLAEGGMLTGNEQATRVALLTGSSSTSARRRALLDIASGEAGIVIGTHALIQEGVDFHDLALVVVDEQHRFGVEQRDALRAKGSQPPHVLVMTATPIPRTVAMTVFGDMETSTLRELPRGRQPIATHVVPEDRPEWVARTWQRLAEEVRAGHQAYVVCPRISATETGLSEGEDLPEAPESDAEEGSASAADGVESPVGHRGRPGDGGGDSRDEGRDGSRGDGQHESRGEGSEGASSVSTTRPVPERPMASVEAVHAELAALPVLSGTTIERLHGRMSPEEKDDVMTRFSRGEIDILVSTTVVEVGVDVPAATVMVVRDADRFGVSQLHQLRGRVGRGAHPGLCLLMTSAADGGAAERLGAVASTTDGFELARLDLSQRREGDVLGTRQSGGRSQLEFLSLLRDEDLVTQAREDAAGLVQDDPDLTAWPDLAREVARWEDAERAAYLEKG